MCLIGGLRDLGIGTDTLVYTEDYFNSARDYAISDLFTHEALEDYDKGYFVLNAITTVFSSNYWIILFVTQLVTIGLTYWGVYRLSNHFEISYVVFTFLFCFLFYNQTFNYMRQFCALGLLLFAFSYFIEQKYIHYFTFQIIAFLFHSSSGLFVFVPIFYYMFNHHFGTKQLYLMLAGYVLLILFLVFDFYEILYYTVDLGVFNMDYADRYGEDSDFVESDGLPRTTLFLMLFPFLLYSIAYYKRTISPQLFSFFIIIHVSYVAVFSLAIYVVFLQRLGLYFYYIDIFFIAHILSNEQFVKKVSLLYALLVIYCWYNMYIVNNDCETYPYTSSLLGIY